MKVAVSGTPGTGKSTATDRLETDFEIVHLNEVIEREGLIEGSDPERDTVIADMVAVEAWLDEQDDVVIESHLAHHFEADRVIVLRCHPDELTRRLRERGDSASKIQENVESETLDIILSEAVQTHGEDHVFEIDTSDRRPGEVATEIDAVIAGERAPRVGIVSFVDQL